MTYSYIHMGHPPLRIARKVQDARRRPREPLVIPDF